MWAGSPKWVGGDRRSPGGSDGGEGWRRVGVAKGGGRRWRGDEEDWRGRKEGEATVAMVLARGRRCVGNRGGSMLRCDDAVVEVDLLEETRRATTSSVSLGGFGQPGEPRAGVGPSLITWEPGSWSSDPPKALSSHSGSLHPCPNSPSFYQSPISNGTYRPVASVASGVSRPDEARSCLRVLSQTPSATQQTAKPNQPQLPHPLHFQHRHPRKDTRSLSLSRQLGAATMFRNNYDNDSVTL